MRKLRRLAGGRLLPCVLLALFFALAAVALSVLLPRLLAPVAAVGALLSLAAALTVACSDEPGEYKISKLVLIFLLPWTGAALCLLWASAPYSPAAPHAASGKGRMGRAFSLCEGCGLAPSNARSATYFPVGKDMADALLSDLKTAKRCVFLQYFIVERGAFFTAILQELASCAKRGVDVRLLYDDFGSSLTLPRDFARSLERVGVRAAPVRKLRFPTRAAGRRDHRKLAVIDGEVAYTGGVNLADEYVGARLRFGHWKDTAVRIEGEPALRFAEIFARTWRAECPSVPIEIPQKPQNAVGNIPCAVVSDGAEKGERTGKKLIEMLVSSAEKTLYLNTPYLAPDASLAESIARAAAGGVDVRLMLPRIPDKKLPYRVSLSYARELEARGARVRLYTAGFLHAKSLVSDGVYALVSSYNLDFRSLYLQAECGALIESAPLAADLERDFLDAWKDGAPLPAAGPFSRAWGKILRLFAPLL